MAPRPHASRSPRIPECEAEFAADACRPIQTAQWPRDFAVRVGNLPVSRPVPYHATEAGRERTPRNDHAKRPKARLLPRLPWEIETEQLLPGRKFPATRDGTPWRSL